MMLDVSVSLALTLVHRFLDLIRAHFQVKLVFQLYSALT